MNTAGYRWTRRRTHEDACGSRWLVCASQGRATDYVSSYDFDSVRTHEGRSVRLFNFIGEQHSRVPAGALLGQFYTPLTMADPPKALPGEGERPRVLGPGCGKGFVSYKGSRIRIEPG